jgi:hypothetical protein
MSAQMYTRMELIMNDLDQQLTCHQSVNVYRQFLRLKASNSCPADDNKIGISALELVQDRRQVVAFLQSCSLVQLTQIILEMNIPVVTPVDSTHQPSTNESLPLQESATAPAINKPHSTKTFICHYDDGSYCTIHVPDTKKSILSRDIVMLSPDTNTETNTIHNNWLRTQHFQELSLSQPIPDHHSLTLDTNLYYQPQPLFGAALFKNDRHLVRTSEIAPTNQEFVIVDDYMTSQTQQAAPTNPWSCGDSDTSLVIDSGCNDPINQNSHTSPSVSCLIM